MIMVQSRVQTRHPKPQGEVVAEGAAAVAKPLRELHVHRTTIPTPEPDNDSFHNGGPPAKRRKIILRHKQSTLDNFTVTQSDAPKPPNSVTAVAPHGQLVETINGVRSTLDTGLDDVAAPSTRTSRRSSRQPSAPPPPQQQATAGAEKKEEKRTLRSQDEGHRLKSELAVYFSDYEDVVFGAPKRKGRITVETVLYVTEHAPEDEEVPDSEPPSPHSEIALPPRIETSTSAPSTERLPYNGCPIIDLDKLAPHIPHHPVDPLDDAYFLKSHRRAERREKQLRNIEKERAMHEKVQLERILDGLLGHDWLKVLGVTGITDGEAKKYEPKRDHFVAEVQSLLDKFKLWKEQERRQRLEKDAAAAREESEEPGDTEDGSVEPPSSELNASASRQLQHETNSAVRSGFKIRIGRRRTDGGAASTASTPTSAPHSMRPPPLPPQHVPPEPITSFYAKRHLREAALSKTRHAGRNVTAFGLPVPDIGEREFVLPEDYVTEDALRASARERRRRKRASVADAAAAS